MRGRERERKQPCNKLRACESVKFACVRVCVYMCVRVRVKFDFELYYISSKPVCFAYAYMEREQKMIDRTRVCVRCRSFSLVIIRIRVYTKGSSLALRCRWRGEMKVSP